MEAHPPDRDFRPLPFLGNAHLQTVLGSLLLTPPFSALSHARPVRLPDGDQLLLHDSIPGGWKAGGPIAVLIHGLTGSHRSSYVQRLAGQLLPRGIRAVRLDLRGAGQGVTLARRPYHAGCSDDVRAALAEVHRWSPASPLVLVGFSLGGNVSLKLTGEAADDPVPNLVGTVAVGPPIDLKKCLQLLMLPRNRFYELHFLRHLIALVHRRERLFPDLTKTRFPRGINIQQFDELYTAPRSGFDGALDYYARASSLPFIPRIQVPTLIVTARDDPFISAEPFETLTDLANVEVRILARGGHLGFLGWDGGGGIYWGERRVVEWIGQRLKAEPRW